MTQDFTIQQIADAAQLTRYQVDAWISRGHFKPENPVENGKARRFTYQDAVSLTVLADFSRLGLPPTVVSMHLIQLQWREEGDTLFVISSVFKHVKPTKANPDLSGEIDITTGHVMPPAGVASILNDRQVHAFAVVNLDQLEDRVQASLGIN